MNEPEAQQAYTDAFLKMNKLIQSYAFDSDEDGNEMVMAVTAMMIGGVAVARTLNNTRAQAELLHSCRNIALGLLEKK